MTATRRVATYAVDALSVEAKDFSVRISVGDIAHNWDAVSFTPERWAAMELRGLAADINAFAEYVAEIKGAGGAVNPAEEVSAFARRAVALKRAAWAADGRTMSSFIVGPAKFPTERNRKRIDAAEKKYQACRDHRAAARKAVKRKAWPHGAPGEPVRGSNPDAVEELERRIADRQRRQERMKLANKAIRAWLRKSDEPAALVERLEVVGFSKSQATTMTVPDCIGRYGFSFELQNNGAEIKRLQKRLEGLKSQLAAGSSEAAVETVHGTVTVRESVEADRLQLIFPGKPSAEARAALKSRGFRWSPHSGAWQRVLNNAARHAAACALEEIRGASPARPADPSPLPPARSGSE